jgi:thiol-disulfide isomerase/thioredoxin
MHKLIGLTMVALLFQAPDAERRIIEYLRKNVVPGKPVVVSDLYNNVFKTPEERKVLDRLFNTFFKIPMFIVQFNAGTKRVPTLNEISEQFNFTVPGEADVILRVMEADPRVPRFMERNPRTGEIVRIDVEKIKASKQFSAAIERSITGWEGKEAPPFAIKAYDGKAVTSQEVTGRPHLIYFWFTNCPPCVKSSPILAALDAKYTPRGFRIIGANADQVLELPYDDKVRADYSRKYGFKFTTAHLTPQMQQSYGGVSVFPTMFFVNRAGVVVKHFVNFQNEATLEAAIQAALK